MLFVISAAESTDNDDYDSLKTSSLSDVIAADTSASVFLSNYILAKLLGTSPITGAFLPPDIPVDELQLVPFAAASHAGDTEPISSVRAVNVTVANNRSASTNQSNLVKLRRVPVNGQNHRHQLDINKAQEMLMEWNGERGKAHSVSNAAANFVVFAPLSAGRVVGMPPTAASVAVQPSSTRPALSLRAIVDKSFDDYMTATTTDNQRHVPADSESTMELDEFKSGPVLEDTVNEHEEDIGFIAHEPVHLQSRLFLGTAKPYEADKTTDNSPWSIRDKSDPAARLSVSNIQLTSGGSDELRDSVATTDPTAYTYALLSAASQPADDDKRYDSDVVRYDVVYDVTDDDSDEVRENVIDHQEENRDERASPLLTGDIRRLSPKFLRVMKSLWPGLEICVGRQCTTRPTDTLLPAASQHTALSPRGEHDVPTMNVSKMNSVLSKSAQAGEDRDIVIQTVSAESTTTPQISVDDTTWQTNTSLRHRLKQTVDNLRAITRRQDLRSKQTAATDDDQQPETLTITVSPTSTVGVYDSDLSRRLQLMVQNNAKRNRSAVNDVERRRLAGSLRADPTRRQRHGFLSSRGTSTIVRPRADVRGLPDRRRAYDSSDLVRSGAAALHRNEETRLGHRLSSLLNTALLRGVSVSVTTQAPEVDVDENSAKTVTVDRRNNETTQQKPSSRLSQLLSNVDQERTTTLEQNTWQSLSKLRRGQGGQKARNDKATVETRARPSSYRILTTATSTSSKLPPLSDQLHSDIYQTTSSTADRSLSVDSMTVSIPGGEELLPIHSMPGDDGRSAAAIATLSCGLCVATAHWKSFGPQ